MVRPGGTAPCSRPPKYLFIMPVLQLPIFPLPLVLFPGAPQLLHIFEPRYRAMLTDCMDGDRRFGVSWVDVEAESDPTPRAGGVGCVAYVQATTALADGRSNILAVGEDRYVLREYMEAGRPYRVAKVETFDDDPEFDSEATVLGERVGQAFTKLATILGALNDSSAASLELARDPKALSFQVAAAIEIDAQAKLELLALRSTLGRLRALERLVRMVADGLAPRAEVHVRARRNGKGGENPAIAKGA